MLFTPLNYTKFVNYSCPVHEHELLYMKTKQTNKQTSKNHVNDSYLYEEERYISQEMLSNGRASHQ